QVAQVSKPAVSQTSKSANRTQFEQPQNSAAPAGLETCDTADLEVCATPPCARACSSALLLTMCFVTLQSLSGAETKGEDWPRFLGPLGNGISHETGLLDKWPTNGPPLLWEKSIGTGYGAPSVRGDDLVFHHRLRDEEIVECVEAATGKPHWRYAYPSHFVDP